MSFRKATDLRPGMRKKAVHTISSVTFAQGRVRVQWDDGTENSFLEDDQIELED